MSKKKSFSGSTMTLKDFHGGSIPSDIPLPSAPGVSVKPPERPAAWGLRGDPSRARPASAGGIGSGARASLDDRVLSPFLPPNEQVGRHFDEDERKPFDSSRRLASFHHHHHIPVSRPISAGPTVPNAWAPPMHQQQQHASWNVPAPLVSASKLVQASAVEKIVSGRWNSKQSSPDIEVINYHENESVDRRFTESVWISNNLEKEKLRVARFIETREKNSVESYSDSQPRDHERVDSPSIKAKKMVRFQFEDEQPASSEGRLEDLLHNQQAVEEVSDRPKFKLLPRTKPLEMPESSAVERKQVQVQHLQVKPLHAVSVPVVQGSMVSPKSGSAGDDAGSRPVERPRLNLKPRSQPVRQSDDNSERERSSVFGGARPRELVLKERGVDPATQLDSTVQGDRVKHDLPKSEMKQPISPTLRPNERAETFLPEQRRGRDSERRNYHPDYEKVAMGGSSRRNEQAEMHGSSRRNEQKRNIREIEKPPEQRRREPDSWRKPLEEPKPDVTGHRFGKAASPLELAQAFSKSVFDNRRGVPGRSQVPFSRLTDARDIYTGRVPRQINGY